ncbi:two-component system, chemotaxis family, response regulator WspR [Mariprofundus aestuarium]|uniref:diguanylate cyclase n=1 Tax=Mariprofundus aestuarium TaxID=1921086 RepID=A0A2K8L3M4_MARES|nr:diguanylate cyclase [Mariprofundus aestuarium]ATX78846.1 two-component system, chemotaxis family, response regulator WspR [Mariprofundus aestuarium]
MADQKINAGIGVPAKAPFRVLLVDDQAIIFEAVRRMLSAANDIELHYCGEGAKALQMASEVKPDVILQDLIMPDVDGLMLVKFYRANAATTEIPVVVLSSKEEAKTKAEAFHCGANDYLVKLPDQIEMLARLRYHAKTHKTLLERNAAVEELKRISLTDGLTKINNRRHFDMTLLGEFKRARREKSSLAVVMLDVDHFKQFNDNYGHQAGDECLVQVAEALQSSISRPADMVARYGGEEFVAILPDTSREGMLHVAEKIRQAVFNLQIPHEYSSVESVVTVSLGVAQMMPAPEAEDSQVELLIKLADQGLYEAKESGRNRIAGVN